LTDEHLHALVANNPNDEDLLQELRQRVRWAAIRAIPARRGYCSAGKRVVLDEKGAYSSGYPMHYEEEFTTCMHTGRIVFDEPNARTLRLQALIEELRP
jgi:hypothetical protein